MYCEYCKKPIGYKKNGKEYKHVNIGQTISVHLFCSRGCKTNWCFAVQENRMSPNENSSSLLVNLEDKLVSEIKDLSALEDFLSKKEYKKRYIEILNKEELKQLNLINDIKDRMSFEA